MVDYKEALASLDKFHKTPYAEKMHPEVDGGDAWLKDPIKVGYHLYEVAEQIREFREIQPLRLGPEERFWFNGRWHDPRLKRHLRRAARRAKIKSWLTFGLW